MDQSTNQFGPSQRSTCLSPLHQNEIHGVLGWVSWGHLFCYRIISQCLTMSKAKLQMCLCFLFIVFAVHLNAQKNYESMAMKRLKV